MQQSITLPSNPAQITKELVKASFQVEKTRFNYQAVLQATESLEWTRENINEDLLAPAKFVAKALTDKKDRDKKPLIAAGKIIQEEYNSVFNPLNDVISRKAEAKKELALVIQKEKDTANAAIAKELELEKRVFDFILNVTDDISNAENDTVLVAIEKRIGAETTRKNYYDDKIDILKSQCEEIRPLIKKQKDYIRALRTATDSQRQAEKTGDEQKEIEMRHKAEDMKEFIDENKLRIQQKALEQIQNIDTKIGEVMGDDIKATRTWWKWEIEDINLLNKKMPHLVELCPRKEAIDSILSQKRDEGEFDGKSEVKLNGIRFYLEKSFK